MIKVTLYLHDQCPDCDQALYDLKSLQDVIPHELKIVRPTEPGLLKTLGPLPVVECGPYHIRPPFNRQDLQLILSSARDRLEQIKRVDQDIYQKQVDKGQGLQSADRVSLWLARHYLALVNLFVFLYVGLPFLAPVLLQANQPLPANIIYKAYSMMCHQLAFRSFFLYGEQAFYPRELAGIDNVTTYEAVTNSTAIDSADANVQSAALLEARAFTGNPVTGYKVALCERDVAIYGTMLLFGLLFGLTGKRWRAIPWYAWVVIGLVPIGLDGTSQLPSLMPWLPSWLHFIVRESTPLFRVVTGAMFGGATALYLLPMLEETARDTRQVVERKVQILKQAAEKTA